MSEAFSDTQEPSTPQQAQRIVDLIYTLEHQDADHDPFHGIRETIEEIPESIESIIPPGIVAGHRQHVTSFAILGSETDVLDRLERVPEPAEWHWADSQKAEDVSSCFYDVRAE